MANITQRQNKSGGASYLIRVFIGQSPDGRQIIRSMTWRAPAGMRPSSARKQAEREAALFEQKVKCGGACSGGRTRFADYAARWIEAAEIAPATRGYYEYLLRRVCPGIGHITLENLRADHIRMFLKNLREDGSLSDRTIRHHHAIIRAILSSAKRARMVPHNVAQEFMSAPKAPRGEARYLGDGEAREFLAVLMREEDIRIKTALALSLFTGIRRGELCGLSWADVDFDKGVIRIRKASQYVPGRGIIEVPAKNRSSERNITVSPFVISLLREYYESREAKLAGRDDPARRNSRLFTQADGKPIFPNTINFWLARFTERNGLPHINPHALRHTFITLQITAGVDLRTLQARSGHAHASTLLNVYAHAIDSAQERAAEALDKVLLGEGFDKN